MPGEEIDKEYVFIPMKEGRMKLDMVSVKVQSLSNRAIETYFDIPTAMVHNEGSLY